MKNSIQIMFLNFILLTAISTAAQMNSGNIRDSADKTKKSNQSGQMINMAVGAANLATAAKCFSQCSSGGGCCAMAPAFLAMGMANMAQAKADGKTASQASGTVRMTDVGNYGGGFESGYDPNAVNKLLNDPELKAGYEFGNSMTNVDPSKGMSWDSKTGVVTTASGKTYKASDFNSPTSMAAAGMSKGMIDSIMGMEKKIQDNAMKKLDKMGLNTPVVASEEESGGGGGGGFTGGGGNSEAYSNAGADTGGPKLGIDRDPAQVAGMQKDYNGEPIGVAGDSIFKMMTRRYKVKEGQSSFLDDAALLQK